MRIIVVGYYGFGNGGDEALLMSLLQMLPDQVKPVILSHSPDLTWQTYQSLYSPNSDQSNGLEARPRMDGLSLWHCFQTAEALVWGGGSLLQDVTSWRSPLYYLSLMAWAQSRGLQTLAWAQGIGPLQYSWNRWLTRQILLRCTTVSVRDQTAAQQLQAWSIPHQMGPDPVWALKPRYSETWLTWPKPRIAVVLRSHPELSPHRLEHITQALIQVQQQRQAYILLVPFQHNPQTLTGADVDIATLIQARLPDTSQIVILKDPQLLRGLFEQIDLTITMRFHGLVMAAAAGCRCFSLSYDPKVKTLAQALTMPVWDLEAIPDHPDDIAKAWLTCFDDGIQLTQDQVQTWIQACQVHTQILHTYLT